MVIIKTVAAFAALAVASSAVAAPLIVSESATFGPSVGVSVQDTQFDDFRRGTQTVNGPSASLRKFDSSNGVLTGARVRMSASLDQQATFSGGGSGYKELQGVGYTYSNLSAPGVANERIYTTSGGCGSAPGYNPCPQTYSRSNVVSHDVNLTGAALAQYVGAGGVSVSQQRMVQAEGYGIADSTARLSYSSTQYGGSFSVDYSYLKHANGSFAEGSDLNELTIDFGTVLLGSSVSPMAFELFNLGDAATVGLDLDSVVGSGDIGVLGATLSSASNIASGASKAFAAAFATAALGSFTTTYVINLSDFDAGVGMQASQLTLRLLGTVTAPPAGVPEPGMLGLLGFGLVSVVAARRRQAA